MTTDRDIQRVAELKREAYADIKAAEKELENAQKHLAAAQERWLTVAQMSSADHRLAPGG